MKKYIVLLLLLVSNISLLHAEEPLKINVEALCWDSRDIFNGKFSSTHARRERFTITISSNALYQSKDAVQDNTGGYVNIPEDKYYLKIDKDIYRLKGGVERSKKANINQFISHIYNGSQKVINTEELYTLKKSKNLQFIQKINLEYKSNNTTNILDVYFDEISFTKEYQKCEDQVQQSKEKFYRESLYLLLFVFGILYLLRRKLTKR